MMNAINITIAKNNLILRLIIFRLLSKVISNILYKNNIFFQFLFLLNSASLNLSDLCHSEGGGKSDKNRADINVLF
jgi:hypothetical protein